MVISPESAGQSIFLLIEACVRIPITDPWVFLGLKLWSEGKRRENVGVRPNVRERDDRVLRM